MEIVFLQSEAVRRSTKSKKQFQWNRLKGLKIINGRFGHLQPAVEAFFEAFQ